MDYRERTGLHHNRAVAIDGRIVKPEVAGTVQSQGMRAKIKPCLFMSWRKKTKLLSGRCRRIAGQNDLDCLHLVICNIFAGIDKVCAIRKPDGSRQIVDAVQIERSTLLHFDKLVCIRILCRDKRIRTAGDSFDACRFQSSAADNNNALRSIVKRPCSRTIARLYDSAVVDDVADAGNLFRNQFLAGRNAHRRTRSIRKLDALDCHINIDGQSMTACRPNSYNVIRRYRAESAEITPVLV